MNLGGGNYNDYDLLPIYSIMGMPSCRNGRRGGGGARGAGAPYFLFIPPKDILFHIVKFF